MTATTMMRATGIVAARFLRVAITASSTAAAISPINPKSMLRSSLKRMRYYAPRFATGFEQSCTVAAFELGESNKNIDTRRRAGECGLVVLAAPLAPAFLAVTGVEQHRLVGAPAVAMAAFLAAAIALLRRAPFGCTWCRQRRVFVGAMVGQWAFADRHHGAGKTGNIGFLQPLQPDVVAVDGDGDGHAVNPDRLTFVINRKQVVASTQCPRLFAESYNVTI